MQHTEVSEGSMPVLKLVIYQFSVTVDNFKAGEWWKVGEIMNWFNGLSGRFILVGKMDS